MPMKKQFKSRPVLLDAISLQPTELMYYQYLPIVMVDSCQSTLFRLPKNLKWVLPLLGKLVGNIFPDDYVYLTVKHMWVTDKAANRHGWHIDGFLTDDTTYIWSDAHPTEFCEQEFLLTEDHEQSMIEMGEQVKPENCFTYPNNSLVMLDTSTVHRVNTNPFEGFRTFVKISVSKEKYNLEGNSHNYLFDYNWPMVKRKPERNHPIGEQK